MIKRMTSILTTGLAVAALCVASTTAHGQTVVDYTGSVSPSFTFAAFDGTPVAGPEGLALVLGASADNFGGLGTTAGDLLAAPTLTATGTGFVTARTIAGNDQDLVVTFREATNEFFSYLIPASSFNDTTFTTVEFGLDSFFFNGDVTDAVPNESIIEVGVQSPFGQGNAFAFEVAQQGLVSQAIPEPSTLGLMAAGLIGLVTRRRRS